MEDQEWFFKQDRVVVNLFDKNGIQTVDSNDDYKKCYKTERSTYIDEEAMENHKG